MKSGTTIIIGDSRRMEELKDEGIHLVITSPPYWQLKDYGNGNQIGFNDSYEDYINNLNLVWKECYRVLHKGCRLCVNIGDQFARSVYYGRYKIIPIREEIIRFCETIGFDYMGAIIWQKVTTCNTTGGASIMGSFPYPRNGIIKLDYEFILIFKKLGEAPKVSREIKEKSKRNQNSPPKSGMNIFTDTGILPVRSRISTLPCSRKSCQNGSSGCSALSVTRYLTLSWAAVPPALQQ